MDEEKRTEQVPAMISAFAYECAMAHKDADNERLSKECERLHKHNRTLSIIILIIVFIFATTYTIRTKFWLDTYDRIRLTPITEVQDGVYTRPDQ